MNIHAGVTLAHGLVRSRATRGPFTEYREAEVKTTITVPKGETSVAQVRRLPSPAAQAGVPVTRASHGPFVPERRSRRRSRRSREIRVHGNASVRDDEVIKLAGIALGDRCRPSALEAIEQRLKDSGQFETVEVRKRYRSLDDPTDVAIVLVVHERPGVDVGDDRRRDPSGVRGAADEPADVPADPQLRRWLRLHLRRTGQHDRLCSASASGCRCR